MESFVLYWRDGKHEVVRGRDIADAMTRRGYGNGALRALDFYGNGSEVAYSWNGKGWETSPPEGSK